MYRSFRVGWEEERGGGRTAREGGEREDPTPSGGWERTWQSLTQDMKNRRQIQSVKGERGGGGGGGKGGREKVSSAPLLSIQPL